MIAEEVARRICSLAEERKMTKYHLAEKCPELAQSTVYNAANGDGAVTIETLDYICRGLEISVPEFFRWDDDKDIHLNDTERLVVETMRRMPDKQIQRLLGYLSSLEDMTE